VSLKIIVPLAAAPALAITALLDLVAPTPEPPPHAYIEVHSITYSPAGGGMIVQDRTIMPDDGQDVVLMGWAAQYVSAETDAPVRGCTGSGSWPYSGGRGAYPIPVNQWVGSDECALPTGHYYPRAVFDTPGGQVSARGAIFEVTE